MMGEAKRRTSYFRGMPDMKEFTDPIRAAAIHLLYERAKRNIIAKAKADGVDVGDTDVVMSVAPPERQIEVAMADVREVLSFLGLEAPPTIEASVN